VGPPPRRRLHCAAIESNVDSEGWSFWERENHSSGPKICLNNSLTKAPKPIHPEVRGAVYAIVLSTGEQDQYDAILELLKIALTANEKNSALAARGYAKDPALIERTLNLSISGEVKSQDFYTVVDRPEHQGVLAHLGWLRHNWSVLKDKCGTGPNMLETGLF